MGSLWGNEWSRRTRLLDTDFQAENTCPLRQSLLMILFKTFTLFNAVFRINKQVITLLTGPIIVACQ
jgi:hypothetical protein